MTSNRIWREGSKHMLKTLREVRGGYSCHARERRDSFDCRISLGGR